MAFIGMDPTVVREIGQQLKSQADQIGAIISSVDRLADRADGAWRGQDASRFHGWWVQQHRPALQRLQDAVAGLGQSALNNATAQDTTSSTAGATATAHGGAALGHVPTQDHAGSTHDGDSGSSAFHDVMGEVGTASASVGLGASMGSLLRHRGSLKTLSWSKLSVRGARSLLANGEHVTAELRPLERVLGPVGILVNSGTVLDDMATGANASEQLTDIANLGVSGLALAAPEIGLPIAAAQTGWAVGNDIAQIPAVHQQLMNWGDAAYSQALADSGGDPTVVADRYDGVTGFGHFMEDSAEAGWHKLTKWL